MPHNKRKLLADISISCKEITDFISGKSFEYHQDYRMLQLAIEREFEIIGEALSRLASIDDPQESQNIQLYTTL